MSWFNLVRFAALACVGLVIALPASAADKPGVEALDEYRKGLSEPNAIENRFFLKEGRFEIAPHVGYVPNNSFARRYVGGVALNYHFNERLAVGADVTYSPDLGKNDLKQLVGILLDRAYNASGANANFQQPLDKVTLSAAFGVAWAPVYGKINLIGETVLNFDFYGFAGLGMVSKQNYTATYDPNVVQIAAPNDVVLLTPGNNEVQIAPTIGLGQNYFLNQMLALKIDAKASFYLDDKPQYDPDVPVQQKQLYNNFITSVGIAAFFPKMKPRLYDF
ncbi:MAG: outer membrane beta-barrel domain-containing protein [Alphaproteobacteria bacterium]|nr:outer membrane beta-barrel domain-containing protein [Alphaproteobacteria bacterium]